MTTFKKLGISKERTSYRVTPAVTRVNARLDADRMHKLEQLAKTTGLSLSDVIRDAIDHYAAAKQVQNGPSAYEIMQRIGFIGCAKGPKDLSTQYKKYLTESLQKKHGYR
ncbi:MAG: ribbon-helix-helix domain-containing protein [Pseudomonadota bacterium]|nr:ribbon-helix-helix domain-containing protein [Pseudomonadota bacterium]